MSNKFEVEFCDVEGTKFRPFRLHAIRMPNGAIYDAVNGWRKDCPHPVNDEKHKNDMEGLWNRLSIEAACIAPDGTIRIRMLLLEEDVNSKGRKWPEIAYDYGELVFHLDMEQQFVETDFIGTIMVARND